MIKRKKSRHCYNVSFAFLNENDVVCLSDCIINSISKICSPEDIDLLKKIITKNYNAENVVILSIFYLGKEAV